MRRKTHLVAGFVALETLAIVVLVILVVIVASAILISNRTQTVKTEAASAQHIQDPETFKKSLSDLQKTKKNELIQTSDLFSQAYDGVPFNERLFNNSQRALGPLQAPDAEPIESTRFEAIVLSVQKTPDLHLSLKSLVPSFAGRTVEFVYLESVLPRITMTSGGSLEDLQTGDHITIDETHNLALPYQQGIIRVEIQRL